jgi:phage shock protein PspC (stress-responsive transcriptional regulator)
MESTPPTPALPPPPPPTEPAGPRRLTRSTTDRMLGGVAGGIGKYFGIDPTLVRIGLVALALFGGTGLIVYAAALLLVPLDDETASAGVSAPRDRNVAIGLVIAFVLVCIVIGGGFGFALGGALAPIGFLALAGLAVWWFVSGERPSGSPATVVRRAAIGVALIIGCFALAVGSFLASGLGGGVVTAAIVIAAGAGLVAAAFVGGARWLVLPALAIALPLAFVSAAGIDLNGGFGERNERPATVAELDAGYRLGAGELVVDLRQIDLPAGDHPLKVRIGAGHALVIVPEDVCVASRAEVGMGGVAVFDRDGGGIDVDWKDTRQAPKNTPRIVLDGDVGLGLLEVRHTRNNPRGPDWDDRSDERNSACSTS